MCTSHIHIPIHTCTSPHKRILTYKHMNISVNTHSQTLPKDAHINVCIPHPHTCTHLYTCIPSPKLTHMHSSRTHTHMHVYINVPTLTHKHIHINVHLQLPQLLLIYTHTPTQRCTYAPTPHTQSLTYTHMQIPHIDTHVLSSIHTTFTLLSDLEYVHMCLK